MVGWHIRGQMGQGEGHIVVDLVQPHQFLWYMCSVATASDYFSTETVPAKVPLEVCRMDDVCD